MNEDIWIDSESNKAKHRKHCKKRRWIVVLFSVAMIAMASLGVKFVQDLVERAAADDENAKEELWIGVDYRVVVASCLTLPYEYDLKGVRNTLKVVLDKLESAYAKDNRVVVVVHGFAKLTGQETGRDKASCKVMLKYSAPIVYRCGKLTVGDRLLEKFEAFSSDLNVESIMETKAVECWRDFQRTLKCWERSISVPYNVSDNIQLEVDGLFVREK